MFPTSLHTYAALMAFLISALTWRKWRGTAFRWFPFFLFFIALAGLNRWHPVISGIAFLFYAYVYSQSLQKPWHKKFIQWFILTDPGLVLADCLFQHTGWHAFFCPMTIGSLCMILLSCLYFYELLLNPVQDKLHKDPLFWFSTGILFFYLGELGQTLLYHFVLQYAGAIGMKLFLNINNNLILILYSCFILGFLCKKNLRRSLSR